MLRICINLTLICFGLFALAQSPGELGYEDQSDFPEGIEGERLQAAIQALNGNDPAHIQQFLEKHCSLEFREQASMAEHIAVFQQTYERTGGMEFHSIRHYTPARPDEIVAILQDRWFESWRAIVFRLEEEGEQRISSLYFAPARTPSNVQEPPMKEAELIEKAKKLMGKLCSQDVFSGTVLIAHREKVLFTYVCGEASKRFHVANTLDTKFNLGSMNKMFTATAIAQLAEQGKLSFDDPISRYVDESWLPKSITDRIQVHHLLTHTSGLGSYFNRAYWQSSRELYRSVSDYKSLVSGDTLAFTPGERFQYSNTGMLLLGVVIESASGQDYFDYVRQHIYAPAGMKSSDSYEMDQPVENLAIGYISTKENAYGWENNLYKHVIKGGPAGGGFSTVEDLHRFALALIRGKLVQKSSLDQLWHDHAGESYGYGFSVESSPRGMVVGHGGGFPGLNANLDLFVDSGYIIAVMSNYDQAASPVARRLHQWVMRIP